MDSTAVLRPEAVITKKKNYGYSIIRFLGALLIFVAHTVSVFGHAVLNDMLGPFTVVFLMLSGYLYSGKDLSVPESRPGFVVKNFLKILIDYYLVALLVFIPAYCLVKPEMITGTNLKNLIFCRGGWNGIHHLWYIPHCLFGYLIIPMLYDAKAFAKKKNRLISVILGLLLLTEIILRVFQDALVAGTFFTFIFGYFRPEIEKKKLDNKFLAVSLPLSLIVRGVTLWVKHYGAPSGAVVLTGRVYYLFVFVFDFAFNLFGICLFMLIKKLFTNIKVGKTLERFLDLSDRYAYDFFLVHMIFVIGCLSVLGKLGNTALEVLLSFVISLAAAVVIGKLRELVSKPIFKFYNRYF